MAVMWRQNVRIATQVRIDKAVYDAVRRSARTADRSIAREIERILREALGVPRGDDIRGDDETVREET